eukprot:358796-Chlamydomonas_euryale.AAC.7
MPNEELSIPGALGGARGGRGRDGSAGLSLRSDVRRDRGSARAPADRVLALTAQLARAAMPTKAKTMAGGGGNGKGAQSLAECHADSDPRVLFVCRGGGSEPCVSRIPIALPAGFPEDLAFFSVFDGHGGSEVAQVRAHVRGHSVQLNSATVACLRAGHGESRKKGAGGRGRRDT